MPPSAIATPKHAPAPSAPQTRERPTPAVTTGKPDEHAPDAGKPDLGKPAKSKPGAGKHDKQGDAPAFDLLP